LNRGGIGITPFRSMIHHAAAERTAQQLWLFYSNTRPESAAFLNELRNVADATASFHFVPRAGASIPTFRLQAVGVYFAHVVENPARGSGDDDKRERQTGIGED
jgi:NAD(P)H-flavin reductase